MTAQLNEGLDCAGTVADAGWHKTEEMAGVPLWQWQEDPTIRVLTRDHDILRIIGAALNWVDVVSNAESHRFVEAHLYGGRSGMCTDE